MFLTIFQMLLEVTFFTDNVTLQELLIVALSEAEYESFWEQETQLSAYVPTTLFDEELVRQLAATHQLHYLIQEAGITQWQTTHAQEAEVVYIDDYCAIAPPDIPPAAGYPYWLHIRPTMAFGDGQHPSTRLCMQLLLAQAPLRGNALDIGCGTGVLMLLAARLGAKAIVGIDNNPWAIAATEDTLQLNQQTAQALYTGHLEDFPELQAQRFDWVLANLNASVLRTALPACALQVAPGGYLLTGGVTDTDDAEIHQLALNSGLVQVTERCAETWVARLYRRG
jgi:ribosomal protein L11 methyltransferase